MNTFFSLPNYNYKAEKANHLLVRMKAVTSF